MAAKSCPAGSQLLMAGAVSDLQACRLMDVGLCSDPLADPATDFCQDGTDMTCPMGL